MYFIRTIFVYALLLLLNEPSHATTPTHEENKENSKAPPSDKDRKRFTFLVSGGHRHEDKDKAVRFMVSIRSRVPTKYFGDNHFCAGSIISPRAILTAAHCVMDKRKVLTRPRRLIIVAGTPNRLKISNTTVQYPVESVVAHPKYIRYNTHDLAIIIIKDTIPPDNPAIEVIPLPKEPPAYGKNCLVIGWGRLYYNGPLAALTSHVEITIYKPEKCRAMSPKFTEGMLCAGDSVLYNEDPCRGDSGGPIICNDVLTGVVSWTIGCGSKSYPSLFTDVYYHLDWIQRTTNDGEARKAQLILTLMSLLLWAF